MSTFLFTTLQRTLKNAYPLLRSQDQLTLRALTVPCIGSLEASVRNTRVKRSSLEDIGVSTHEDVSHHGTGGGTSSEDVCSVDAPVGDRVADGGDDAKRVAATVVRESRVGGDVPAGAGVGLRSTRTC